MLPAATFNIKTIDEITTGDKFSEHGNKLSFIILTVLFFYHAVDFRCLDEQTWTDWPSAHFPLTTMVKVLMVKRCNLSQYISIQCCTLVSHSDTLDVYDEYVFPHIFVVSTRDKHSISFDKLLS